MRNMRTGVRGLVILTVLVLSCACEVMPAVSPASTQAATHSVHGTPKVPDPVVVFAVEGRQRSGGPVTFGQPFVAGDVPRGTSLKAMTFDGREIPSQVDWKATHADGSLRHGIVTVRLPESVAGKNVSVGLYRTSRDAAGTRESGAAVPKNIDARVALDIDGESYTASFQALRASGGLDRTWLSGPLVTEWHVSGPVRTPSGKKHDRLWVQFYVRHYAVSGKTRVVTVIENTWAFQPKPRNVTYDAHIFVNDKAVYSQKNLTHTDRARWREQFWVGGSPQPFVVHDLAYLKATGTIPNYDPQLRISPGHLRHLYARYRKSDHGPMDISIVTNSMHNTGGRPDIGPLPGWTVSRLLTMNPRLAEVNRRIGSLAGSWPVHLRDKKTKRPVSLDDHPNLTTHPNILHRAKNPLVVPEYGEYPNNLRPDTSHQPSLAFVPYLLSGDYYYLEELQFWNAWNPLRTSPKYRGRDRALMGWMTTRGQAWSLRTLGQAAYITPDADPTKEYWRRKLEQNLDWYDENFVNNPDANRLGFVGGRFAYNHGRGIAPWQDDFLTWTMGYLVQLGFDDARPMLDYKTRFPVGRMTAPGYCWVLGAIYKLNVRDTSKSPFYDTFARAYSESVSPEVAAAKCGSAEMASALGKKYKAGDMVGHPSSALGFPSNMQPALATAVDSGAPHAVRAWKIFMNRATKPNYSHNPVWAIVPTSTGKSPKAH